jgi:hypothetical protein
MQLRAMCAISSLFTRGGGDTYPVSLSTPVVQPLAGHDGHTDRDRSIVMAISMGISE